MTLAKMISERIELPVQDVIGRGDIERLSSKSEFCSAVQDATVLFCTKRNNFAVQSIEFGGEAQPVSPLIPDPSTVFPALFVQQLIHHFPKPE